MSSTCRYMGSRICVLGVLIVASSLVLQYISSCIGGIVKSVVRIQSFSSVVQENVCSRIVGCPRRLLHSQMCTRTKPLSLRSKRLHRAWIVKRGLRKRNVELVRMQGRYVNNPQPQRKNTKTPSAKAVAYSLLVLPQLTSNQSIHNQEINPI